MKESRELGHMGDGVYLSHDGYQHWLAVNHHENKVVALEDHVAMRVCTAIIEDLFGKVLARKALAALPQYLPSTKEGAN
jgi:surface polysaccharide O-acyltransferase-like enzyme